MNNMLKWMGMVCVIAGALLTSLRIDPINIWALNAGAFLYLVHSYRTRRGWDLVAVNGVLLACYLVGLFYTPT